MALQKLREYFQETNINQFQRTLGNRVLVVEKVSAPSFYIRKNKDAFEFYKGSNKDALTIVDRTIMSLYEPAIKHIESLIPESKEALPTDWKFGFEYLPETSVSEYKYTKLPQNNLILTHIQQVNESGKVKKTIIDPNILNKWASILEVQAQSVIFDGQLSHLQKEQLINLLSMNDKEFSESFDYDIETENKTSFTKSIYRIFNHNATNTVLQEDLESEIDGLVLNFVNGRQIESYKLEDFNRQSLNENRQSSHIYQITIADILEYVNLINLDEIKLNEESADTRYIELISEIFNQYITKNAAKYVGVNFESADFASANSFKLNTKFIKNEKTIQHTNNDILTELFKIMLGTFRKERTKPSDILTTEMLKQLNKTIQKINDKIFVENTDEHSIYDYQNFMLHNNIKANTVMNEALKVDHAEHGKELVNMFVGRFQPFTLGHAKVLEAIHKENGYPVVVLLVKSKNPKRKKGDEFSKPYDADLQIKMFNNVKKQYKFLKEIIIIPTGGIDTIFNALRPKYEPVLWGTGTDRLKSYGYQVNNDSYRDQLNAREDFGLFEIPRTGENISATKVRNAMLDDNESDFKKWTPKAIHKMYGELKSKLEDSMAMVESVQPALMTFKQFINERYNTISNEDNMENNTIISESSLSRIWRHVTKHESGTISAFRGRENCGEGNKIDKNTNKTNNAILKRKLLAMGYGVTKVTGTYIENYGESNAQKVKEESFIVVDLKDAGNLQSDLVKLGQYFEQDSITFSKPNGEYYLVSSNTCPTGYPGKGKVGVSIKLGKPFFGKSGEFYSTVNGRPFVFENMQADLDTINSYSIAEIRSIKKIGEDINI